MTATWKFQEIGSNLYIQLVTPSGLVLVSEVWDIKNQKLR